MSIRLPAAKSAAAIERQVRPLAEQRGEVDRIAFKPSELAPTLDYTRRYVGQRCEKGTCAYVKLSARCLLILEGDWQILYPFGHEVFHREDDTGPRVVARAFPGRERLSLAEVAAALGLHVRTLQRAAREGKVPIEVDELDRRFIRREAFVHWLLRSRVPTRWETGGAK